MPEHDEQIAAAVRAKMAPLVQSPGAIKTLSIKSGLSEPTLRKIVDTGVVSSHRTAAALEALSDGAIPAASSIQPGARGSNFYSRQPAQSILAKALSLKISVADFLAKLGLTHHDLWVYMNHGDGLSDAVKQRVRSALQQHGLPVDIEVKQ